MSDKEKGWIRTMIEELNSRIEKNSPQMVESLSEIVRIPSKYGEPKEGAPYGEASRQALKFAMDLGRKLGFETVVNVDDRVCYIEYGTGSKVVGVFAHLDVVPEDKPKFYAYAESIPNVLECNCVTGEYSMLMKVAFQSTMELDIFIGQLQKFGKTSTQIVFSTHVGPRGVDVEE